MRKKIYLLNVRVCTEDAEEIRSAAKALGKTLSAFLRDSALAMARRAA